MTATEASARAKRSWNKGRSFEQDLARYLRRWWPRAVRAVRTGSSAAADPGDIAGVPGVIISAKDVAEDRASKPSTWVEWWAELDAMLAADPAALGVIIHKRKGHTDPGEAWCHLRLGDLTRLNGDPTSWRIGQAPARITVAVFVELLAQNGYARPEVLT